MNSVAHEVDNIKVLCLHTLLHKSYTCWELLLGSLIMQRWKEIFGGEVLISVVLHLKTKSSIKPVSSSLVSFFFTSVVHSLITHLARFLVHFTLRYTIHSRFLYSLPLCMLTSLYQPLSFLPLLSTHLPFHMPLYSHSYIYPLCHFHQAPTTFSFLPPLHPIFYSTYQSRS